MSQAASELLENEFLAAQLEQRAEDIKAAWESADSTEAREALHVELRALRNLSDSLYAAARDAMKTGGGE